MNQHEEAIVITKASWIKTNLGFVISTIALIIVVVVFIQNLRADIKSKADTVRVEQVEQRQERLEEIQDINTKLLFMIAKELDIKTTDLLLEYTKIKKKEE